MDNEKISTNQDLAESLQPDMKFEFSRYFLVKPLALDKVKKEFETPIPSKDQKGKDENGIDATDYSETKKEIKTVDSDWRKAIVLKTPMINSQNNSGEFSFISNIKVGDTVIYRNKHGFPFDLYRDSELVSGYDIVAVSK